ncbi:hypothetical protein JOD29_000497 [Lysinibacillus composti]|uniref:Uncharacterized protein n=1 Tax=Lysinibacillus composti TaxID=720633 RepID=A0A3N9UJH1_9BACI|nr:hypothetical protein [Lysinibacillus composti]MBM7607260.1 hypothetical protein [Lysinibacillus composti]RQW76163.1 hypothetical protein EBB45_01030 [Lysinibacillus composti]
MELDKLWNGMERARDKSVTAEILAWTYHNYPGEKIKDIRTKFDEWSIEDFKEVLEHLEHLPPFEGEADKETMFGYSFGNPDFYEGSNLTLMADWIWHEVSKPKRKSKFF